MHKKIVYTKHAQEMLLHRNVKKIFVQRCLGNPDIVLPSKKDRKIYVKNVGKRDLKVVCVENDEIIVITCHWIASSRIK